MSSALLKRKWSSVVDFPIVFVVHAFGTIESRTLFYMQPVRYSEEYSSVSRSTGKRFSGSFYSL
jgi:hypothetical protein